jgi:hypothetical protein
MREKVKSGILYMVMCEKKAWGIMKDTGEGLRQVEWNSCTENKCDELLCGIIAHKIIVEKKLENTDKYSLEINRQDFCVSRII